MSDIFSQTKRSDIMSKISSKDTKPEILVRKFLFSKGFRYRINVKTLPGKPDIVLPKYKTIIFVNGCFWHGHEIDGHIPHSNIDFWKKKIERNKQRDERNKETLKRLGWKVMTVWECQLKSAIREQTLLEMEYWINHSYLERFRQKQPKLYRVEEANLAIAAEEYIKYRKFK